MDIVKEISLEQTLCQVAEECMELGKACLKLQRILDGRNPTPVTEEEARASIMEEATDLQDCLRLLGKAGIATVDHNQSREKAKRWEERIREAKLKKKREAGK